VTWCLD